MGSPALAQARSMVPEAVLFLVGGDGWELVQGGVQKRGDQAWRGCGPEGKQPQLERRGGQRRREQEQEPASLAECASARSGVHDKHRYYTWYGKIIDRQEPTPSCGFKLPTFQSATQPSDGNTEAEKSQQLCYSHGENGPSRGRQRTTQGHEPFSRFSASSMETLINSTFWLLGFQPARPGAQVTPRLNFTAVYVPQTCLFHKIATISHFY
ncbi:uncharacterized protein LOC134293776 [Anolis carolinensis]|uniref:uncharacterized protein LOC134293776 n=1 Tax=Anolis carolinensis TaxID=28377 RepID=UPI002F2B4566